MNEFEKFIGELSGEDKGVENIFEENLQEEKKPEEGEKKEEDTEARKNRRHRRLEDQLRKERESNIALNERIKTLAEIKIESAGSSNDMPAEWVALYGDTPEAKTAWAMQERMFKMHKEEAKKEAIAEFQEQQNAVAEKQKEFESFIDSELESLEDEHNIDLTSDAPSARKARRELLEMVQKISPKDENGNISGYADFSATFELYKSSKSKTNDTVSRQKQIAAKSMQESGSLNKKAVEFDATLDYLRKNGIRV